MSSNTNLFRYILLTVLQTVPQRKSQKISWGGGGLEVLMIEILSIFPARKQSDAALLYLYQMTSK
jgi:hypothetical protein